MGAGGVDRRSATGRRRPPPAVTPWIAVTVLALTTILLAACGSFEPRPMADVPFPARTQVQQEGDVRVSVAVPTVEEARKVFGLDIHAKGIQPIWVHIENDSDRDYLLFPVAMDADYFSPQEAAWKSRVFLGGEVNERMSDHFDDLSVPVYVGPGTSASGFVFTNPDPGFTYVQVELRTAGQIRNFEFVVEVPGLRRDYESVDFHNLYAPDEWQVVDDAGLRRALEALPCCVLGGDRKTPGDPLNIAVIAPPDGVAFPFIRRGWDATETAHGGSIWRTVQSSLFGVQYRTSPVSPLYLYGRPQDFALQKARSSVDERNHLRLWLSPLRYGDNLVWVGQISRDIGVRMSSRTFVTHKIDPDVDEARYYLLQDMVASGSLVRLGWVEGVGSAARDAPRFNYTHDPYFTDGLRVVLWVGKERVPFEDVEFWDWGDPAIELRRDPRRGGARKSGAASRGTVDGGRP